MPSLFTPPLVTVVYSTLALCNGFVRLRFCKREMFRGLMTRNFETNFAVFLFFFFLVFHYEDYVNIRLCNVFLFSFILFLTTWLIFLFYIFEISRFLLIVKGIVLFCFDQICRNAWLLLFFLLSEFFFSFLFLLFYIFIYFYFFIVFHLFKLTKRPRFDKGI